MLAMHRPCRDLPHGSELASLLEMPKKSTAQKARRIQRSGKKSSTAAGPFVREEMHKRKRGGGAARSRKQAIAIGLSKARRSGIAVKKKGTAKRRATSRKRSARKAPARRKARSRS
jgi:hypothetical protein